MTKEVWTFILDCKPKNYYRQYGYNFCGMYSIKAIVEAKNPEMDKSVFSYASSHRWRYSGLMGLWKIIETLDKYDIAVEKAHCRSSDDEKRINLLKKKLRNWPVLLFISHAYTGKKKFIRTNAILFQHYITLWGYNDKEDHFYIYDSSAADELIKTDLPAWNSFMEYRDLMTYWRRAGLGIMNYTYISTNIK